MKLGIIISVVILLAVGSIAFLAMHGIADSPTSASAPARLVKVELPIRLPAIGEPGTDSSGDTSGGLYRAALDYFVRYEKELNSAEPNPARADELVGQFIAAMRAPLTADSFLDDLVPVQAGGDSKLGAAVALAPQVVVIRAAQLHKAGKTTRAIEAIESAFVFGQRLFNQSVRFDNRYAGLEAMIQAAGELYGFGPEQVSRVEPWVAPLTGIRDNWIKKIQVVRKPSPRVGDLVNVARNDKDPTFRVEATIWLGPARYHPGGRGNARAIADTIEDAKSSADPLLAAAGRYADELRIEEMRRIR